MLHLSVEMPIEILAVSDPQDEDAQDVPVDGVGDSVAA